jgi:iron(III) transport system substrate-binding protein
MLIFGLALPLVFARGNRDRGPSGKITIYTSMYGSIVEEIEKILARKFPGCQIVFFYGGTGTIQARIASEMASGRLGCDILLLAEPSYSLELKENGMLHSYISSEAAHLAFDYDPDGYWYPVRISNMVLAYNPARNSRNTLPDSFHGFANDTRLRGAISMSNPLTSGTALAAIAALRDKYGYDFFDALGSQNIQIDSGSVAMTKLETGEYRVIMILEESILQKREEENSRLEVIYPTDGTVMIPSTIMIINDQWSANRNTAAAQVIADWFLSEEGQNAIVSGWMHSVRNDFDRLPNGAISTNEIRANSMPVDWERVFRQRESLRTRFEEYVIYRRR